MIHCATLTPFLRLRRALLRITLLAAVASVPAVNAQAQNAGTPYTISTVAGLAGERQVANGTGTTARFYAPSGLVFDPVGNLIVADTCNNLFRRVTSAGVATYFSGSPINNDDRPINIGSADGAANSASFHIGDYAATAPYAPPIYTIVGSYTMAADGAGNVYFADTLNNTIRKLGADGTASTIAGQAGEQGVTDGTGGAARFLSPAGVAIDGSGNLYVTDSGNNTIRKVTPGGVVTTLAGGARLAGSTDGTGTAARFNNPSGIVADSAGNLYVTDSGNHTIRRVSSSGVVTTFAGVAGASGAADGSGTSARFNGPTGIAIDGGGNIFVADTYNHLVRRITPTRTVSTIAGAAGASGGADGTGNEARFFEPSGVVVDGSGTIYISDTGNNTIRRATAATGAGVSLQVQSQPQRQFVIVGASTTFKVVATGTPAPTYQWQKNGLAISGATGATYTIGSTQFADAGLYSVVVTSGVVSFNSVPAQLQVFPVGTPIPPIVVLVQPTDQIEVSVGQSISLNVEVAGTTAPTFQWKKNDVSIPGATSANLTIGAAQFSDAGLYVLTITDGANSTTTLGTTLIILAAGPDAAPVITSQPAAQSINTGGTATFSVSVTGSPAPTFTWRKNGTPISNGATSSGAVVSGATTSTITLAGVAAADAGNYSVAVTNSAGAVTSNAATLTVNSAPAAGSRIINLSVLTSVGGGGDSFTMGYVVGGAGTTGAKPLVIRAAGPSLGAPPLNVPNTLDDPKIELFANGSTKTGENDNWGGSDEVRIAMAAVGAFPYSGPTSRDSAVATSITTRDNSVKVSAAGSGTGTVIAEVYDASPDASLTGLTPRLINVSVLKNIGSKLTVGFVIRGPVAKKIMVRAVGPTLALPVFGVPGVVANPQMELFRKGTRISGNDNWGDTAELTQAFSAVGAFALAAGSLDAALIATLEPDDYSVEVTGVGNTTGTALVEVYELP